MLIQPNDNLTNKSSIVLFKRRERKAFCHLCIASKRTAKLKMMIKPGYVVLCAFFALQLVKFVDAQPEFEEDFGGMSVLIMSVYSHS